METSKTNGWQARWFHFVMWLAIVTIFILFLRAVQPILLPFVLGILIAYLMDPVACRLQRSGFGRSGAAALLTLALTGAVVAFVLWLVPTVYEQLSKLVAVAPAMLHDIESNARSWASPVLAHLNQLTGGSAPDAIPTNTSEIVERALLTIGTFARGVFASGAAFVNVMALLLITPIVCFYLIRDWTAAVRRVDSLLPLAYAPVIREQLHLINRTLASYLRGQLTVMLFMSLFYVVAFSAIGLTFGLALALLAGITVIIPYIGSVISISLGLMVAYGQFDITTSFWLVAAAFGAGQILEQQVLTPKIIGDRVGLHPLWMLFGMLAGAVLLGFVGVLLAVPLTAVIGVLVKFAVGRYLESGLYLNH